jgi:hypothetical protein
MENYTVKIYRENATKIIHSLTSTSQVARAIADNTRNDANRNDLLVHIYDPAIGIIYHGPLGKLTFRALRTQRAAKFEGMSNVDGEQFAHYSGVVL